MPVVRTRSRNSRDLRIPCSFRKPIPPYRKPIWSIQARSDSADSLDAIPMNAGARVDLSTACSQIAVD